MGALPLKIHPDVPAEAKAARLWYAERSEKAAARFVIALDNAIEKIRETPERWPSYVRGTRRYRLSRFPYLVVYRIGTDAVEIIAVQHGRRRPGYWKGRMG